MLTLENSCPLLLHSHGSSSPVRREINTYRLAAAYVTECDPTSHSNSCSQFIKPRNSRKCSGIKDEMNDVCREKLILDRRMNFFLKAFQRFESSCDSQSSPSYRPLPCVAHVAWMYHCDKNRMQIMLLSTYQMRLMNQDSATKIHIEKLDKLPLHF